MTLQVIEINMNTVRHEAKRLTENSDAGDRDTTATTFLLLDERFHRIQTEADGIVRFIKVGLDYITLGSW